MTILIVENSLQISVRIKDLLMETGNTGTIYQSVCHNKISSFFEEINPQVVLLDMCLPEKLAFNFLKRTKKDAAKTKVIALVNCVHNGEHFKSISAYADFVIDKYHEFEKIPGIVSSIGSNQTPTTIYEKPKQQQHSKVA